MKTWFAADHHFDHTNIIKYANRPFACKEVMNIEMINRHNSVVAPDDDVYFIGDFSFCQPAKTVDILKQMNGRKYFIPGNHDKGMNTAEIKAQFVRFYPYDSHPTIKVQGAGGQHQSIVLNHFAQRVWNRSHHGVWHLYGHSHGSLPDDPNAYSLDVGVDCWDFYPVSFAQIAQKMKQKTFVPVDHHGAS